MSIVKKVLLGLIAVFIIMQFFRIDKTNPLGDVAMDIANMPDMPKEINDMLRTSCYDCHSNEVVYPWYSNVAPVSWIVKDHINEGRDELNFSEWGSYSLRRQDHKLDEIAEQVEDGEMPLKGYTIIHRDAQLDKQQQEQLIEWSKKARKALGYQGEDSK